MFNVKTVAGGLVLLYIFAVSLWHYGLVDTPPPFWPQRAGAVMVQQHQASAVPEFREELTTSQQVPHGGGSPRVINPGGLRLAEEARLRICEIHGPGREIDVTPYIGQTGFQSINCTLN